MVHCSLKKWMDIDPYIIREALSNAIAHQDYR